MNSWLPYVCAALTAAAVLLAALSARQGSRLAAWWAGLCFVALTVAALMLDWPWEALLLCALAALTASRLPRKERRSEL